MNALFFEANILGSEFHFFTSSNCYCDRQYVREKTVRRASFLTGERVFEATLLVDNTLTGLFPSTITHVTGSSAVQKMSVRASFSRFFSDRRIFV